MKNRDIPTGESVNTLIKVNQLLDQTDIRILVYAPPIIGFVGLLLVIVTLNLFTHGNPNRSLTDILLGILFLLPCFSGYAEIHKKEMPAPLGGVYKGNLAVVSGVLIIILFGFFSIAAFIHGFATLLS
jgi:hypothetical protein